MGLFSRNKTIPVQNFILKMVNNHCSEMKACIEGPRRDRRINLTLAVLIVPVEKDELLLDQAFCAVTKEFSIKGVSIVMDRQRTLKDVILNFRNEGEVTHLLAKAKHISPLGCGFYQLGLEMLEIVHSSDYPQLKSFDI